MDAASRLWRRIRYGETSRSQLYSPLDSTKQEIRLVTLLPRQPHSDRLCCTLSTISLLGTCEQYRSVSYVWGSFKKTERILVNNVVLRVTPNLVSFLRQMQPGVGQPVGLPLWIDTICIDQANVKEKSSQVALMGQVYSRALESISWLGEAAEDSDLAMDTARTSAPIMWEHGMLTSHCFDEDHMQHLRTVDCNAPKGMPPNRAWLSLFRLLQRPYWTRLWTFQEAVLPPVVTLMCGNSTVSMKDLGLVVEWLVVHVQYERPPSVDAALWKVLTDPTGIFLETGLMNATMVSSLKRARQETLTSTSLPSDLRASDMGLLPRLLQATDARDIVYGILGVFRLSIIPNYERTVREVYTELSACFINEGHLGELLHHDSNGVRKGSKNRWKLPTWVADFSSGMFPVFAPDGIQMFDADNQRNATNVDRPTQPMGSDKLRVSTVQCGQVQVIKPIDSDRSGSGLVELLMDAAADAEQRYPTGIPMIQALVRLVLEETDGVENFVRLDPSDHTGLQTIAVLFFSRLQEKSVQYIAQDEYWKRLGFSTSVPEYDKLQAMLFGARINEERGPIQPDDLILNHPKRDAEVRFILGNLNTANYFRTMDGHFGTCNGNIEEGDQVRIVFGCQRPVIVRPVEDHYIFIGTCIVVGWMDGEAVNGVEAGHQSIETIVIH